MLMSWAGAGLALGRGGFAVGRGSEVGVEVLVHKRDPTLTERLHCCRWVDMVPKSRRHRLVSREDRLEEES